MHFLLSVITKNSPESPFFQRELATRLEPFDEENCYPEIIYDIDQIEKIIERYREDHFNEEIDSEKKLEILSSEYGEEVYFPDGNESCCVIYHPNENAKWDYYDVQESRWGKAIETRTGEKVNACRLSEFNYKGSKTDYAEAEKIWDAIMGKIPFDEDTKSYSSVNPEYYLCNYGTKEEFAEVYSNFFTDSILLPDGEWVENDGEYSEKEWLKKYLSMLKKLDQNYYLVLVDCHI